MTPHDDQWPSAPPDDRHSASLSVMGVDCRVTSNTGDVIPLVRAFCAPGAGITAHDAPPSMALHIQVGRGLPEIPPGAAFRFEHFGTVCYSDHQSLWLQDSGVVGRLIGGEAFGLLCWGVQDEAGLHGLQRALIVTVIELLRRAGRYQLHASCVARNGLCVLFPGEQRSGKTTAALAMARGGWQCLTDDLVFLCRGPAPDQVSALGWQEHLNVGVPTLDAFGLREHVEGLRTDGRFTVDPAHAVSPAAAGLHSPGVIILTQIADDARSRLQPAKRGTVLARIIRHSPLVLVTGIRAEEHLSVLHDLVAQCACYELHAGRDVLEGALPALVGPVVEVAD